MRNLQMYFVVSEGICLGIATALELELINV